MITIAPIPLGVPSIGRYALQISPAPNFFSASYVSDGDANGVCTYLGKLATGTWANPYPSQLGITASSLNTGSDTVDKLVNHISDHCDTGIATSSEYYQFDFGAARKLFCNKFSFRWRPDDSTAYTPNGWLLKGSNDLSTWDTLLTVSGATPGLGTWRSDDVPATTAYRYFRLIHTTNMNGTNFFVVNEVEFYGLLLF